MTCKAAQHGFFGVVRTVGNVEDERGVAGEMADGTEQVALVFGWVMLDDGNFGVTVVAETVEPVGGSGGAEWIVEADVARNALSHFLQHEVDFAADRGVSGQKGGVACRMVGL